jgi:hypothetical protein
MQRWIGGGLGGTGLYLQNFSMYNKGIYYTVTRVNNGPLLSIFKYSASVKFPDFFSLGHRSLSAIKRNEPSCSPLLQQTKLSAICCVNNISKIAVYNL